MTDKSVSDIVKNLVLANEDDDIKALAAVTINANGEAEMYLAFEGNQAYSVIASFEILKFNVMRQLLDQGSRPLGNRE